jgi:YidC/Oxa1 family membrane protein insertase
MQLTRDGNAPAGDSRFYSTYTGPVIYTEEKKFQKVDFSDIEKGKGDHVKAAPDGWAGIIQHYFVSAWLPTESAPREYFTRKIDTNLYAVGALQPLGEVAPGASVTASTRLLIAPQDQRMLETVAPGLDLTVDYGWLTVIAKPIFWLLQYLHGIVGNWGWAIVLLTVLIKTAFFPLQAASYKSMARMKAVTPRLMQLRERYGSDRVRMNQAMMELYKEEKINPLGGCLPIVVQIPVFIALYWVLLASVEMRNAPWILWIHDLAVPDPWYLLPLIMAGTMFIQVKLNPTPPDPVQAKVMMVMPIVFSVMFFFFPAGLVLYWLVNNIYSIAQQWYITKSIEKAAAAKKA